MNYIRKENAVFRQQKQDRYFQKCVAVRMTPRIEGKMFLTKEKMTVRFVEDVNFRILYGAAKVTKDRENNFRR